MRKHVSWSIVWWTAVRLLVDVVGFALSGFRSRSQPAAGPSVVAAMEHLRAQPCGGDARLRFLRNHHGEVSHAVRLCGPGRRDASDRALERDGAPDGRLDRATVPCVCPRRSTATLA